MLGGRHVRGRLAVDGAEGRLLGGPQGLKVAARATRFLDMVAEDRIGSCYGYTNGGKRPYLDINWEISATTPIGLLCRMYTGWEHKRPGLGQGVERLKFWARPGRGMYYYYYATQVMHHYGGSSWEKWNSFMVNYTRFSPRANRARNLAAGC